MLRFRVSMMFPPQAADEALHALRALTGPVRAEPGCTASRLSRDLDDGGLIAWVAEWRTREDFRHHLESRAFRSVVAVMELAAAVPVVEIDEVTSRRGFDLVEELLAATVALGTADVQAQLSLKP